MKALLVGAVESTRVALRTIAAAPGWTAEAVMTLPPSLGHRHSDFADLRADAEAAGARLIEAADCNAPEAIAAMRETGADATFVIGWSQICRANFLKAAGGRAFGYHPAPLPRLRGRAVIPWTILLDFPITAGSLFWLDDGVDAGPLLGQRYFHVAPDETAASLYGKHLAALEGVLREGLAALAAGDPPREVQDARLATWCAKRTPQDGSIDWRMPAAQVWRLIRAVGRPYPGAFTTYKDEVLRLWSARPWDEGGRHVGMPGQVIATESASFAVLCGDGALWVDDWEGLRAPAMHARLGAGHAP